MNDYDLISLPERFLSADSKAIITTTVSLSKSFHITHERIISHIENMAIPDDLRSPHFRPFEDKGKIAYQLTRDGMLLTVMQLPGRHASLFKLAYINAFNDMASTQHRAKAGEVEKAINQMYKLTTDEVKAVMLACIERLSG